MNGSIRIRSLALLFSAALLVSPGCVASGPNLKGLGHQRPHSGGDPSFAKPPIDAQRLPSGVAYKVIKPGTGAIHPDAGSLVRVGFEGFRSDGSLFDSSARKGKPQIFDLAQVVRGLSEGIVHMVEGEVARFWIPAGLAYGEHPEDTRLPAGPLVFQVELLKIVRP